MSKLVSSNQIIKILRKKGFIFICQKGSHAKYRKNTAPSVLTVIIPMGRKEIPYGTFKSILRQASITEEEFREPL